MKNRERERNSSTPYRRNECQGCRYLGVACMRVRICVYVCVCVYVFPFNAPVM